MLSSLVLVLQQVKLANFDLAIAAIAEKEAVKIQIQRNLVYVSSCWGHGLAGMFGDEGGHSHVRPG
eukprot:scaffold15108_cov180-Amphora_coffeaeformis.AAC.100